MFLFVLLYLFSLVVVSKDTPGATRSFRYGKTLWTLSIDIERWVSGDVDTTVFYEAITPTIKYCDERWSIKENEKINYKYLAKVCWYQVRTLAKEEKRLACDDI